MMTRLTDLQSLLLAHAATNEHNALTPLPKSKAADPARVMTAITRLLRRGLLEERESDKPETAVVRNRP